MLTRANLEQFTKQAQTKLENVVREYCQHLFLSYLYQQPRSEKLLFKGGTALRIIFHSPRYSEDLDFTGVSITQRGVEEIFTNTLVDIENTGIRVELEEGKPTTGGYLGIIEFDIYDKKIEIFFEVSFFQYLLFPFQVQATSALPEGPFFSLLNQACFYAEQKSH